MASLIAASLFERTVSLMVYSIRALLSVLTEFEMILVDIETENGIHEHNGRNNGKYDTSKVIGVGFHDILVDAIR